MSTRSAAPNKISVSMKDGHGPAMVDLLTPIWERLLERAPIGSEENFFDLGGDPPRAVKLFREIAKVCGRELPPLTIYQAPTISALASLVEQPRNARFPPLVLLKAGAEKPPVYIAHGLGSSVMELFHLVKHLEAGHPVYGLQAKGIDGVSTPFHSIEEKAQVYLAAIKQVQPSGPYFLIGYSLGGLVMFEMARRLSKKGERVGLLAMVDSYPHACRLSPAERVRLNTRVAQRRASTALRSAMRVLGLAPGQPRNINVYGTPLHGSFAPAMQLVRDRTYSALKRYKPRFYAGAISFVRAEIGTTFPEDPVPVWERLAAEFHVETVPGDHLGMLTTHFESLASVLNRFLRCALCR